MSTNEPSEQTKALLERTRAKNKTPTATVIEDATVPASEHRSIVAPSPAAADEAQADNGDDLKVKTRTMSRTEAEQERGRQIIQKNQEARKRAAKAQQDSDDANEK